MKERFERFMSLRADALEEIRFAVRLPFEGDEPRQNAPEDHEPKQRWRCVCIPTNDSV